LKKALSKPNRKPFNIELLRGEHCLFPVLEWYDKQWRTSAGNLPEGVRYNGCYRASVDEEVAQTCLRNTVRLFDLSRSRLMCVVTSFLVGDVEVKKYVLLPVMSPGHTLELSGVWYGISRSLLDRVIAINNNSTIFLRLQQDRKVIHKDNRFAINITDKHRVNGTVPNIEIIKEHKVSTLLYVLVKHNLKKTIKLCGFNDFKVLDTPETTDSETKVFKSTSTSAPLLYIHYKPHPEDTSCSFKASILVTNILDVFDQYPQYLNTVEKVHDRYSYHRCLGLAIYPKSPELKRVNELETHFTHLEQYVDKMTLESIQIYFKEPEILAIRDIYDICLYVTMNYDSFLESERDPLSIENRVYDLSPPFQFMSIMVNRLVRELVKASSKRRLRVHDANKLLRPLAKMVYSMRKHPNTHVMNYPGDNMIKASTGNVEIGGTRNKKSKGGGKIERTPAVASALGNVFSVRKSNLSPFNTMNNHLFLDKHNQPIIDAEDRALIDHTQGLLTEPLD